MRLSALPFCLPPRLRVQLPRVVLLCYIGRQIDLIMLISDFIVEERLQDETLCEVKFL